MELTNYFQAEGPIAYVRARDAELRKVIEAKYANVLATASWFERLLIRFEMRCELLRAKREGKGTTHEPSPYTLW